MTAGVPRRTSGALVALVAWLAATNVARSLVVPDGVHLAWNLMIGAGAALIGWWAAMGWDELGLARADLGAGLRWGLGALAVISVPLVAARLLPAGDEWFADGRADLGVGGMLVRALVVIPVGTVLVEELAFRGVLHGLLRRRLDVRPALLVGAALFGLWHLTPTLTGALDAGDPALGVTVGTVAATTVAGIGFGWLRVRSGSLLAPILAHIATNSVAFALAWTAVR